MSTEPYAYHRRLPHWRANDSIYFVTWRLTHTQFPMSPDERTLVAGAIEHFQSVRYSLDAYVVMDDHVHVILCLIEGNQLHEIVHSWKSFTAHAMTRSKTRTAPVWQDEYWDRIIRDEAEFAEKVNYVLNNPQKRWPDMDDFPWVKAYCMGD